MSKIIKKFKLFENSSDEIIEEIEELFGRDEIDLRGSMSSYDGFAIHTNKQTIYLLIENDQNCCEKFGYFFTNDEYKSFIGSKLIGVKIVDECLNVSRLDEITDGPEERETMFVNIETSEGLLQFTAYNCHNGYYGHTAIVRSEQINRDRNL